MVVHRSFLLSFIRRSEKSVTRRLFTDCEGMGSGQARYTGYSCSSLVLSALWGSVASQATGVKICKPHCTYQRRCHFRVMLLKVLGKIVLHPFLVRVSERRLSV